MNRIWAPWRIRYILGKKQKGCFLCIKKTKGYALKHFVLAETRNCLVLLNKYPYAAGHLMVIPRKHIADLDGLTGEELSEFFHLVRAAAGALKKALKPQGLNIGANLGSAAGAGADDHFHFHIVPRWNGDHNFMPVLGRTIILPDYLESTYKKLLPYFQAVSIRAGR